MRKNVLLLGLASALAGSLLMGTAHAAVANAEASPSSPRLVSVSKQNMKIIRYDAKIASANGYVIKKDSAGRQYSVRAGSPTSVRPLNVVTGNCGSSFVFLYDIGDKKYRVKTGFGVVSPAISYTWRATVIGPSYNHTHTWSGGLWLRTTWEGTAVGLVRYGGNHTVRATGSATLPNGAVCSSLGPIDTELIY